MKVCPQCNQSYLDETLNFCLTDGVPLSLSSYDGDVETVVLPSQSRRVLGNTNKRGVSPAFAYLAVGLLALIAGGAFVIWYKSNDPPQVTNSSQVSNPSTAPSTTNSPYTALNASNKPPTIPNRPESGSSDEQQRTDIVRALNSWAKTLESKDISSHMNLYDQSLDTYFRKSNVDISFVRADCLRLFNKYSSLSLNTSDVGVNLNADGDQATSTFVSTYNFDGAKRHSGKVRSEIRWKKVNGMWKITSQKDLKAF